jgi:hypothetical protein
MEKTHKELHLRQVMFGAVKGHEHTYKFHTNYYFFDEAFKYGAGEKL